MKLIIIPTAGWDYKEQKPDENGILRTEKGVEIIRDNERYRLAFIGAQAKEYWDYFLETHPELSEQVAFYNNLATTTNRDIWKAAKNIDLYFLRQRVNNRKFTYIGVVSYPDHTWRIAWVLRWLGYYPYITRDLSGEKRAYPWIVEKILQFITLVDPYFLWLGLPLVLISIIRLRRSQKTN